MNSGFSGTTKVECISRLKTVGQHRRKDVLSVRFDIRCSFHHSTVLHFAFSPTGGIAQSVIIKTSSYARSRPVRERKGCQQFVMIMPRSIGEDHEMAPKLDSEKGTAAFSKGDQCPLLFPGHADCRQQVLLATCYTQALKASHRPGRTGDQWKWCRRPKQMLLISKISRSRTYPTFPLMTWSTAKTGDVILFSLAASKSMIDGIQIASAIRHPGQSSSRTLGMNFRFDHVKTQSGAAGCGHGIVEKNLLRTEATSFRTCLLCKCLQKSEPT